MESLPTAPTPADLTTPATEAAPPRNDFRGCVKGQKAADHYLQSHSALKNRAELAMVHKAVSLLPTGSSVLDAPCGNGRLIPTIAGLGMRVTGMDFSPHCVANCRQVAAAYEDGRVQVTEGDLSRLPFVEQSFDGVLCFRFFHHLTETNDRAKLIQELCRVSNRYVFLSYLSPYSPGSLKRIVKRTFLTPGKAPARKTATIGELKGHFETQGFRLEKNVARMPLFHSLYLACFERIVE
jgi:ubiquinone/menaquinone biosynthesis C-methylase UbiE